MASREFLELIAALVNITPASYPNDSNLEQAILFAADNVTAGTQTVLTPTVRAKSNAKSGKKNV